ncbi:MAG: hypothetical protein ACJASC_000005 [Limimaricola cinnabarinus]|jgi:hypothetical protein
MISLRTIGQTVFAALLGMAILLWSVMPATSHAPALFETIQEHAEMVAEHGHSHGFEEDLYWAMHGHSHDGADHDHSPALLTFSSLSRPFSAVGSIWHLGAVPTGPTRAFLIERPPRA